MSDGYVRTSTDNGIATITFHHPQSNSLPAAILLELSRAIKDAGSSKDVRVIVLRSDGDRAFCAGASFDELVAIGTEAEGLTFFNGFALVINAIRTAPCIVIGRVQGKAVGGGVGLAAAVDLCYAHESAAVRLSELAIGIGPFVVGPAVERKVGKAAFGLMSTTPAVWRTAEWARAHGLYAECFSDLDGLDAAVAGHARELAGYSPAAMADLKAILWQGTEAWDTLLPERAAVSGRLVLSDFTRKAIAAFKQKAAGK
ncbi:MAG TPA: enoyl-CoA hydratase/isomerase family protein [Flavobacteriales bacterium]|nr:enoyl-CoA hydratase/isomerase family protein [Flavobacteriales bacterium]HRP80831.1 enoyl-CoA hydratase/isomerase family protein [Flavobacteriales bacterium]HRQ85599.1 enoyl-CoA hydratase/isomerase family protein [Flavobacteriales bacterium]